MKAFFVLWLWLLLPLILLYFAVDITVRWLIRVARRRRQWRDWTQHL